MAPKAKKIFNNIKKQEKKIAKKEVAKAKKMIKKKKKWTVAASAMGYHLGYSSRKGILFGKGGLTEHIQTGVSVKQVPASNSAIFTPYYNRKATKNGLIVNGLQLAANIGADNTASTSSCFVLDGTTRAASFFLNPDTFGGQMALDARNYQYFRFKKIRFIFIMPSTATSTPGPNTKLCVGHFQDPRIGSFQTMSYSKLQNGNDSFNFQIVQPLGPLVWNLKQLSATQVKWFNTEQDTASAASERICCQGVVFGYYNTDVATGGGVATTGDVLIEYQLELKERSPDYGFTMSIGDRNLIKEVKTTIEKYVDKERKDCKSEKDMKDLNFYIPAYTSTMRHMKLACGLPAAPAVSSGTAVTIVDATYNPNQPDATQLATVDSKSLHTAAGSSGPVQVDLTTVGGSEVTTYASGMLKVGVDMKQVSGIALNNGSATNGAVPIDIYCVNNNTLATVDVPVSLNRVNNVAINTDGKTPSASVPVNVNAANQVALSNDPNGEIPIDVKRINGTAVKGNADRGNKINGTLPIQIIGTNNSDANSAYSAVINTASVAGLGTWDGSTLAATGTQMVGSTQSVLPTPSLDENYVKVPKSALKPLKDEKQQRGPKGPSLEYNSDDDRDVWSEDIKSFARLNKGTNPFGNPTESDRLMKTLAMFAAERLKQMGVENPEIDMSKKQDDPVRECVRQVITDIFTAEINQD